METDQENSEHTASWELNWQQQQKKGIRATTGRMTRWGAQTQIKHRLIQSLEDE